MMDGLGESDGLIVPAKSSNKVLVTAETMEGSDSTKGNPRQQNTLWTQRQQGVQSALKRIREAARKDRTKRFTCLYHHLYDVAFLREAFHRLKRDAAAGVDGETWQHYERSLEANLHDLSARLKTGCYRAKPVRRVYIPKQDGSLRPLGVPVLEDKIVQRATVAVLNAIYEVDFAGFSYGFRPGRSQHDALDALRAGLTKKVSWVLDADIRGFFNSINHEWLVRFIEHRIGDRRVVRLLQKWLKAGALDDGEWRKCDEGTPQGGSISPLLANVYLHYAFDLWVHRWRRMPGRGMVIVVRWADDFVLGFQSRLDAEKFMVDLHGRLAKFHLELHPGKTRLVEFGRFAAENRARRGEGKPATFSFLGLTHICSQSRGGKFTIKRHTERKRMRAKLKQLKTELLRRLHHPVPIVGRWLASVLKGHYNYYGVSYNFRALEAFRYHLSRLWCNTLRRRSQRTRLNWERMRRLIDKWLPPAYIPRSDFGFMQLELPTVT